MKREEYQRQQLEPRHPYSLFASVPPKHSDSTSYSGRRSIDLQVHEALDQSPIPPGSDSK